MSDTDAKNGDGGIIKAVGYVYVLTSKSSSYVKIGGTNFAPLKRIKEVNGDEPYKSLGPWCLFNFRQVHNWREVEKSIHYALRGKRVKSVLGQKELFEVSPREASEYLEKIDPVSVMHRPKIDRMFGEANFPKFLADLFRHSGILNWLDLQGGWTFTLFPSTSGGRYYTLNMGVHEVAYSLIEGRGQRSEPCHMLHLDRLILDFKDTVTWVRERKGRYENDRYKTGLDRSTAVWFSGDFETAREFLGMPGVRRAMIAYWTEALLDLQERGAQSPHVRFHSMNAVAELKKRIEAGII